MQKQSTLTVLSTLPPSVIATQSQGTIDYTNADSTPLEIRISRAVITLLSGTITVEQTDTGCVLTGRDVHAKLGYIDTDNTTTIVPIQGTSTIVFDTATRTIKWSRPRTN
jgi:hypothetical protein